MSQNPISGEEESTVSETGVGPLIESGVKNKVAVTYDFAKYGGLISAIRLAHKAIPANAVITNSYMDVHTVVTGVGASVAVHVEAADDIQAAAAISGAPWSTTGRKDTTAPEPGTESGYIKTTVPRQVTITITGAALTAGRFTVVIEYDVTNS